MQHIWFHDWQSLLRTLIAGVVTYGALVFLLRISGKRTLSKMNAFDFVVTVAFGSTLATILLSTSVSLAQGIFALALLIFIQFAVTWSSVRIGWVRRLVTGEPELLLFRGKYMEGVLRRTRITHSEVQAAARAEGFAALEKVKAVVLETDGSFSVIGSTEDGSDSTLTGFGKLLEQSEGRPEQTRPVQQ